jgi:uncharacterized lipoprotein YehR (DUF1307 family)
MRKSRFFVLGMLALVFAMALTGCGGDTGKLNGTWVMTQGPYTSEFVLDNGSFQFEKRLKGTYEVKDSTITFTFSDGDKLTGEITSDTTFVYMLSTYTKQ